MINLIWTRRLVLILNPWIPFCPSDVKYIWKGTSAHAPKFLQLNAGGNFNPEIWSLTQKQIKHDFLLHHTLPAKKSVHSADEPRNDMPRELHKAHEGSYAPPRRLLAGAHSQPLGEPQVYRQQKAKRDSDYRLIQTNGEIFSLRSRGQVRHARAPAAGVPLGWQPGAARDRTATIPSGPWRGHFSFDKNVVSSLSGSPCTNSRSTQTQTILQASVWLHFTEVKVFPVCNCCHVTKNRTLVESS